MLIKSCCQDPLNRFLAISPFQFQSTLTGHVFSGVKDGSPASRAGINNGEVLACVEGNDVTLLEHDEAVAKIR